MSFSREAYDNFISGPLPANIFQMQNLTIFRVEYNRMAGPLPAVWTSPNLRHLRLAGNNFTGGLPDGLSNLNATVLQVLDVGNNKLSGSLSSTNWLQRFRALRELNLGGNNWGPAPIPTYLSNLTSLTTLLLHDSGFTDIPAQVATMPSLQILDVSNNELNCPAFTVPARTSNIWHGNFLCAGSPSLVLNPTCTTLPVSARTTPCRYTQQFTNLPSSCNGDGQLKKVDIPVLGNAELFYDPCKPKLRLQFNLVTGVVYSDMSMEKLGDCAIRFCFAEWNTSQLNWTISLSSIASKNNSNVPQLTYHTTLPNLAKFEMPFWFFANPDTLKLYETVLPVEANTVKFGLEVKRFKAIHSFDSKGYFGLDALVRNSEPVLVEPTFLDFIASLTNGSTTASFGMEFPTSKTVLNFRVPLLGQTDNELDIGGSFSSDSFNKSDILLKVLNAEPIAELSIPLRLTIGRFLSYDPDLSLLVDPAAVVLPPNSPPSLLQESVNIGVAVGVSVAVVAAVAGAATVAVIFVRRGRLKVERQKLKDKLEGRDQVSPNPTIEKERGRTVSAWKQAATPSRASNMVNDD